MDDFATDILVPKSECEDSLAGAKLARKVEEKTAKAAIIGLGYVGLPLAMACARAPSFPLWPVEV